MYYADNKVKFVRSGTSYVSILPVHAIPPKINNNYHIAGQILYTCLMGKALNLPDGDCRRRDSGAVF